MTTALLPVAAVAAKTDAGKLPDELCAPSAKTTIGGDGYSNGGVDLTVISDGHKVKASDSGVACCTGATPPPGVPTYDGVTIRLPYSLRIGGQEVLLLRPVTLTPEEAQAESSIQTTFELRGSFVAGKHRAYKAIRNRLLADLPVHHAEALQRRL